MTLTQHASDFELTTDTPYLALTGELWRAYYEKFEENWPHYISTTLYLMHRPQILKENIIFSSNCLYSSTVSCCGCGTVLEICIILCQDVCAELVLRKQIFIIAATERLVLGFSSLCNVISMTFIPYFSDWHVDDWWMFQKLTDKSTLFQVKGWYCQTSSHYLNQCWSNSVTTYGVIRGQWDLALISTDTVQFINHWGRVTHISAWSALAHW